ncbi:cholecystokinin receptor type A-like isoform X2 [Toxorhynchites rutilus septentrionalis]|uniref:cholecystokinin receptor type A-like isoform X2 n=1 Tax=Toxorhynchites rutilus septentrionalis TaxID=329112 RepID=UPI002478694A|nr:cholecystokinin receptor type A-like isoform X2 [Toxorhynchites rutilus septentrionalis]
MDRASVNNKFPTEHLWILTDLNMVNGSALSHRNFDNRTCLDSTVVQPPVTTVDNTSKLAYLLESGRIQIPLYSIIFLLAVIGNSLVILTLVLNRRMRTITNLFLLNLAVSDLFLGVFCMPFTLVGTLLRDFIFGKVMCKLLPYLQASSVAVSAWTLVIISVERYYAICHPLRSRRRQTLSHAYRLIALIWCGSLFFMLPIVILSKLIPTNQGHNKCRELWTNRAVAYSLMTRTLCRRMRDFKHHVKSSATAAADDDKIDIAKDTKEPNTTDREHSSEGIKNNHADEYIGVYSRPNGRINTQFPSSKNHRTTIPPSFLTTTEAGIGGSSNNNSIWSEHTHQWTQRVCYYRNNIHSSSLGTKPITGICREPIRMKNPALRKSNMEKTLMNKKRIIKMLFVVVLEFFLCWTPLYVINTMTLFWPNTIYHNLGYTAISFFQLLAYSSSCCNPITYCFMSRGFRKAFLNLFRYCRPGSDSVRNRRNNVQSGMYVDGSVSCGSMRTISISKIFKSTNRLQYKKTMDTVLSCDGVVSLK